MSLAKRIVEDLKSEMALSNIQFDRLFGQDIDGLGMQIATEVKMKMAVDKDLDPIRTQLTELVQYAVDNGGTLRNRSNFWIMVKTLKGMLEK
jgi:hypothetical protein